MPATALNTILLGAAFVGMLWWWRKGFSLPSFSNPLTGGAANTTIQSVVSVQTFVVMAVFAAFEFTLWKTGWFPGLFDGAGLWHIPYYGALIYLVNLISEKTTGDRKTALMRTMLVVFAISGVSHLVSKDKFVTWWNTPSAPVHTTRVPAPERRVVRTVPTCPGTVETIVVGSEWVEINPGYRCGVALNTTEGVAMVGEPYKYVEDYDGILQDNVLSSDGVRIIYIRAKHGRATVNYVLCPHGRIDTKNTACV